jgi:hypothetical protein|tara:strand:- start:3829 stop:4101 length:273 start_codon:yes stop_codon:yes gene_type:complete
MTEDRYNKLEEKIEALLVTSVRTEEKVSNLEKHTKKMVEKNHTNEYRINKMEIVQTEQFKFQKGFFNTVVTFFVAIIGAFMTAWFNWFHK